MNAKQIEKLEAINEKIFKCKKCDFHRELEEKKIAYCPDAPVEDFIDRDIKIITVGINSGWNDELHKKYLKHYGNFEEYKEYVKEESKNDPRSKYSIVVARTLNKINEHLKIEIENITKENVFKISLWQNLSFCNSQKTYKRIFNGEKISSRVYKEEIPNCLDEGYLKDVISIINPELIVFFTIQALGYIYYKRLIRLLFDLDNYDEIKDFEFPRNKTNRTRGLACKINNKNTKLLFLPHPNSHRFITKDNLDEMIEKLCEKLI